MVKAKKQRRKPGEMNANEREYSEHLDRLKADGVIRDYWFEAVKFVLADRTTFTPDFLVHYPDDEAMFHEVKGRSGDGPWVKEDAHVKTKVAAGKFPFRIAYVWKRKDGTWGSREV